MCDIEGERAQAGEEKVKPMIAPKVTDIKAAYLCVTIQEVARLWNKHPNSVRKAIDEGRLIGRRTYTGAWLVYTPSAYALWGEPRTNFDY